MKSITQSKQVSSSLFLLHPWSSLVHLMQIPVISEWCPLGSLAEGELDIHLFRSPAFTYCPKTHHYFAVSAGRGGKIREYFVVRFTILATPPTVLQAPCDSPAQLSL